MDRACVALCRACLEDTLRNSLTAEMQDEWHDEIARTKRGPLEALIEVCARCGPLGKHKKDAHYVRIEGNKVLHWSEESTKSQQLAREVLSKTRTIIGFIHGNQDK